MINPKFNTVTTLEKGNICIIPSKTNKLGDLVMRNHTVQQLAIDYSVCIGLTDAFFATNASFYKNHSLTNAYLIFPVSIWKLIPFILKIRKLKIDAAVFDMRPLVSQVVFYLAGVKIIIAAKERHFFIRRSTM